jgi:hypothetical protein
MLDKITGKNIIVGTGAISGKMVGFESFSDYIYQVLNIQTIKGNFIIGTFGGFIGWFTKYIFDDLYMLGVMILVMLWSKIYQIIIDYREMPETGFMAVASILGNKLSQVGLELITVTVALVTAHNMAKANGAFTWLPGLVFTFLSAGYFAKAVYLGSILGFIPPAFAKFIQEKLSSKTFSKLKEHKKTDESE